MLFRIKPVAALFAVVIALATLIPAHSAAAATTAEVHLTVTVTLSDECIVDNSDNYPHKKFEQLSGTWSWQADTDACMSEYVWAETSDSSPTASGRWSCTTLPAGSYRVYAWWVAAPDRSTAVPYVIKNGVTELDTVIADQTQSLGNGPAANDWRLLGTYDFDAGGHVVEINNGLTHTTSTELTVCADAVKFVATPPSGCIIDNKDPGFSIVSGKWKTGNDGADRWPLADQASADYRSVHVNRGSKTARARFACATLAAGDYEVFAWWPKLTYSMGDNVPYEIFHSSGSATVRKDQALNGGQWVSLGVYTFLAGAHRVEVHDGQVAPGSYVVADAVRFVAVSVVPTGALKVTLNPPAAVAAGAQWRVDGGPWQNSGATVTGLSVGDHTVEYNSLPDYTSPPNETVAILADTTTQLTRTYEQVPVTGCIIDNKDPGFSIVSGKWKTGNDGADRWPLADQASADYRSVHVNRGSKTARARFACATLAAGDYEVFAWWPKLAHNMADNVPYEIFHSAGSATVRKDQALNGGQWVSLGAYTFLAGAHRVEVHDGQVAPDSYVVADAVRFVKVP